MPGLLCSQPNSWIITTNLLLHRALLCLTLMENYSSGSVAAAACGRLGPARTYSGQLLSGGEERSTRVKNHKRKQDRIFSCSHNVLLPQTKTPWPCHRKIRFLTSPRLCAGGFVDLSFGTWYALIPLLDTQHYQILKSTFFLSAVHVFTLTLYKQVSIKQGVSTFFFLTFQRTTFPNRWHKLQDLTTFDTLFLLKNILCCCVREKWVNCGKH